MLFQELMMAKKDVHVVPHGDGWATKTEGASRVGVKTDTQKEAIERAKVKAERDHVEVVIHGKDNKIRDSDSYGNDPKSSKDKKH
jgi:uncharacterized protein YdaT